MRVSYSKWGGHAHWTFDVEPIGRDTAGHWFGIRRGTPQRRAAEEPVSLAHDCVMLVPTDGCYTAFWNAGEDRVAVYVDVTTRPVVGEDAIQAVDLDLDVIRLRDGTVLLIDEDEFEEHQVTYGYPPWLVAEARSTASWLLDTIRAGDHVFDRAGPDRLAAYQARLP